MVLRMSVERPLWRALTGYRLLALGYALATFVWAYGQLAHPLAGVLYLVLLSVWTVATVPRVLSAQHCTTAFLAADVAMAVVGILGSVYVDADRNIGPTLPTIWVAGPVLAFAVKGGWRLGAVGAVIVGIANILEQGEISRPTLHNVLLVCIASIGIGYVIEVARASERTLEHALRIEAATRERERLARDIHDSVLQVLAMVQRRGTALGGEAAELGRMAGEQEVALRSLVSRDAAAPPASAGAPDATRTDSGRTAGRLPDAAGESDLRPLLSPYAGSGVTFVEPGAPVLLPAGAAKEVAAAVSAALDNVRQHAGGPDGSPAQAWIVVEDEPEAVLVTVRDDGPGLPEGRLADAEAEGRMGVALSIRGRLRDLGGSAELTSVPGQGTEVELRIPRQGAES
jgi:signal transduction histidine kinase